MKQFRRPKKETLRLLLKVLIQIVGASASLHITIHYIATPTSHHADFSAMSIIQITTKVASGGGRMPAFRYLVGDFSKLWLPLEYLQTGMDAPETGIPEKVTSQGAIPMRVRTAVTSSAPLAYEILKRSCAFANAIRRAGT